MSERWARYFVSAGENIFHRRLNIGVALGPILGSKLGCKVSLELAEFMFGSKLGSDDGFVCSGLSGLVVIDGTELGVVDGNDIIEGNEVFEGCSLEELTLGYDEGDVKLDPSLHLTLRIFLMP